MPMSRRTSVIRSSAKDAKEYVTICKGVRDAGVSREEISDDMIREAVKEHHEKNPNRLIAKVRERREREARNVNNESGNVNNESKK